MIKKSVSKSQILSRISEFHVFKRYAPKFEPGILFYGDVGRSGKREKSPSARITFINNRWRYYDFGIGNPLSCWDYLMVKFSITYEESLEKVDQDFGIGFSFANNIQYSNTEYNYDKIIVPRETERKRSVIRIKKSIITQLDLDFWNKNAWTINMLHSAKIRAINAFYLTDNNGELIRFNTKNELAYSYDYYVDKEGIFQRKIYRPNREFGKWYSNVDKSTVQGWDLLPKTGKLCFIAPSLKDCGPHWRINKYPNAIASNNEGSFIPEKVFYKLKQRYKRIIIFWNNDKPGILNAKKYAKIYGIDYIYLPLNAPKDQSDFVSSYRNTKTGLREFNYTLQKLLNEKY